MIQVQPLEVNKFSGGLTDFLFSNDLASANILDNFHVLFNESIMTRPGSVVDDVAPGNGKIPAGNQRIGAFINYANSDKLLVQSSRKIYYRNPSAYATLTGPTGNDVFSVGSTSSIMSKSEWAKHVFVTSDSFPRPMKIFKDDTGTMQVRTSGLPPLASSPVVTAGAAGARNYLYAFHYYYEYMVGSQKFIDAGPVTFVELNNSADPSVSPNAISGIPVLANGVTDNWDTATIKVSIFRTTDGGTDQFFIGQVTNGTTIFNDNFSDAVVSDNELIYLADGTLDNDPPPLSKFVHVVNNIGYYAFIKVGTEEFPFKYRASSPFDPDSCPEDFEDSVEDEITGLSSVQSIPIVLCKRHIYRVEGFFDQYGRGGMSHVRISDNAGCISNSSIVQAENGLFWAGNDGFYYSDGYKVLKISDHRNDAYKLMLEQSTNKLRIYGKFDELNRRIVWGLQTDSGSLDNDTAWVLDLRFGISSKMVFSSWSNEDSFRPTAFEFFDGDLYRADTRGYVFIHNEAHVTDPLVDILANPEDWNKKTIIWHYRSTAMNFGSTYMRKIATKILLTAKNKTNVSIQITAINDEGKISRSLKEIRWRRNFIWGDPEFTWGDPDCIWNAEGLIEQWRRLPANGLRFSYLQIDITNAYTIITNSDTIGTASFNSTTKQIVLDTAAMADWPEDALGYFISTEVDGYVAQFKITARAADTLTVLDPGNQLPQGSLKWVIKGYKNGEILNLLSYNLHWANLSKTQSTFELGQGGENS